MIFTVKMCALLKLSVRNELECNASTLIPLSFWLSAINKLIAMSCVIFRYSIKIHKHSSLRTLHQRYSIRCSIGPQFKIVNKEELNLGRVFLAVINFISTQRNVMQFNEIRCTEMKCDAMQCNAFLLQCNVCFLLFNFPTLSTRKV